MVEGPYMDIDFLLNELRRIFHVLYLVILLMSINYNYNYNPANQPPPAPPLWLGSAEIKSEEPEKVNAEMI